MKNIIKNVGLILIVIFSCANVFFSLYGRESSSVIKNLTSYASFFENRFYDFRMMPNQFIRENLIQKLFWPTLMMNQSKS